MTTTNQTTNQTTSRSALVPDHELLRRLLDGGHLGDLLEIADRARTFRGDPNCAEGECDHDASPGTGVCALLVPMYATADHLELLSALRGLAGRVYTLAAEALAQPGQIGMRAALGEIADLTESERREDDES